MARIVAGDTRWLGDGLALIDLEFQDVAAVIGAYVFDTEDGLAIIDCGPSTTTDALLGGLEALGLDPQRLRHILLTHIHLDHAGAGGLLLRRFPEARLYVHEVGAAHQADPSKLLASATRIYGDQMDTLWGEIAPVAPERMVVIADGETLDIGERQLDVLYTPGHASHHVTYIDRQSRSAFTGDVAGVRIPPADAVWPPTPPPDLDVAAWHASIARLRAAAPARLCLSHYGVVQRVGPHLNELDAHIDEWIALVERLRAEGLQRDAIVERLIAITRADLMALGSDEVTLSRYAWATPYGMAVDGILRFLNKRDRP